MTTRTIPSLSAILALMRLDRPIGIFLLLWPTLWALWLANQGHPPMHLIFIFVLGVIVMRAAGCTINDILDRDIDPHVQRTQQRPIAAGLIRVHHALIVLICLSALALGLVLFLNWQTLVLACGGWMLAMAYPLAKRWIKCPQYVLGIVFSWGIPMAFMASQTQLPTIAWVLYAANILWIIAYDTQYALADQLDDRQLPIHSTALTWGHHTNIIIVALQAMMLIVMGGLGWFEHFTLSYWLALIVTAILFTQQWFWCRHQDSKRCFAAFIHNHWVGLVIFMGIASQFW